MVKKLAALTDQVHQPNKSLSQTVLKALDVLDFIASSPDARRAQEVAEACGLSRPTAYRLLATLVSAGYVAVDEQRRYRLGTQVIVLGRYAISNLNWPVIARPYLRELASSTQETVHLGVLDNNQVLYVDKVESPQSIRMHSTVGVRNQLYCTAMGKAILAQLSEDRCEKLLNSIHLEPRTKNTIAEREALLEHLATVRKNGYAIDDEENEEGIRCVAAAFFDHFDVAVGALSVSGPAYRLSTAKLAEFAEQVKAAASAISVRNL